MPFNMFSLSLFLYTLLAAVAPTQAASSSSTSNSTCGVTLPQNTTASFNIIWGAENAGTNVTTELQALLITQYQFAHENASTSCNGSSQLVAYGNSIVGGWAGPYVPAADFAYEVIGALMNAVKSRNSPDAIIAEFCNSTVNATGQNMGIIVGNFQNVPQIQNAISTWTNGGCMTTNLTQNSTAVPWEKFSLDLRGFPPVVNTSSSSSSSISMSSTKISTATTTGVKPATTATTTAKVTTTGAKAARSLGPDPRRRPRALQPRGDCSTIKVQSGDSCSSLASRCGITGQQFMDYNNQTANLCSTLQVGQSVCCSPGTLPDNAPHQQANGTCATYTVQSGDSCSAIAETNSLTLTQLENYNNNTWGFPGCSDLQIGAVICLSSGNPPMPAPVSNAVCGPQVPGTAVPANISEPGALASLNQCPLNVCCDIWGQCGNTAEFCTPSKSASGAPGTAALGQNGCISNCGTEIVSSSPPAEVFTVGYFEGFNIQRPCLNMDASSIDTSAFTHVHFGFGDISSSYVPSIDSNLTDQWNQFTALSGTKKMLSFGGWAFSTDVSTYTIFREAVLPANRQTFANNVASFIQSSGVDGVDFDWEYPGAPDIPGIPPASPQNGEDYLAFLQLLRAALPSGKLISVTAPSSYWYLRDYPIKQMSEVADYIIMMTYDLHGQWDYGNQYSDPGCPGGNCLRSDVNSTETNTALSMITKAGVPSNKVVVGVTSYGRSFQMTEAGCTGPMCTYTGPESGATPGICTGTAGYLANAEIDLILSEDSSATTFYDGSSESDIMVYNSTQWVSYMSNNTRIARTRTYVSQNFLGTAEWAIDLQSFSATELASLSPEPNCTNYNNYQSVDQILSDSSIPAVCVNMYLMTVLANNVTGSLSDYQSIMSDGYSGKYNAYARLVRSQGYWAWQDNIWGNQNAFWNCLQTNSKGQNESVSCNSFGDSAGNFYYTYKNHTAFCETLENQYGLDCDWVTTVVMPFHTISGGGIACERFGECPQAGIAYYPNLNENFPVLDPSAGITAALANYTNFENWLGDSAFLTTVDLFPESWADVVDGASTTTFSLSGSVQAMQQVADIGAQAEAEQRKAMILAFVTAFLLLVPGIGEAVDGIDALAAVAQIAKLVDVGGNAALSIYGVVQDPKSAPMAIAGILFGAAGLRDDTAWSEAASDARSMSESVISSMGDAVSVGMSKIKSACKECS